MKDLPLAASTRAWLLWLSVSKGAMAFFCLTHPHLLQSTAYAWAEALLPFWVWGLLFAFSAVCSGWGRRHDHEVASWIGIGSAAVLSFVFGLSIFALTFQGIESAIVGSIAWWTTSAVSYWILHRGL